MNYMKHKIHIFTRMALLITLFLVLVNIFNNINSNSPKAEGLTAIEIWMLACILFVFGKNLNIALTLNTWPDNIS